MKDKRQQIIDTAMMLFYAHGYHAVGIDRIIAESGVAKMTLYKYFSSKNDLICAVLQTRHQALLHDLHTFINHFSHPIERLKAIFTWHDRWLNDQSFNGCMFIHAAAEFSNSNIEILTLAKVHKQTIKQDIYLILNQLLDEKSAERISLQILQILEGVIVTSLILDDKNAAITAWRSVAAILQVQGCLLSEISTLL